MTRLPVATYNIRLGGRGRAALREVVRALEVDVLVVNEAPKTPWLWRRRCRRLAEDWGLRVVAGGRPAGSNLILATDAVEVRWVVSHLLPTPLLAPRRGVAVAQLRVQGRLLGVLATHLALDAEGRREQVERVVASARRLRGPVVVGGDLNEGPRGASWQRLRAHGFVDPGGPAGRTFPADHPQRRIDALLVRGDVRVVRHGVPDLPGDLLAKASDHLPVVADLEW